MQLKIMVVPDKFKGCLMARDVVQVIKKAIHNVNKSFEVISCPISDGGEGTLDIFISNLCYLLKKCQIQSLYHNSIEVSYGYSEKESTAIIEMAQSSGLYLLHDNSRNPLLVDSYGFGELIKDALDNGYKTVILALGGVATHDMGFGMARALGYAFLDRDGKPIPENILGLQQLHRIDTTRVHPKIASSKFIVLADVENTICGVAGSVSMYAEQKGADKKMRQQLESLLIHFGKIIKTSLGIDVFNLKYGGAAGATAAGAFAFLNASIVSGIDFLIQKMKIKEKLCDVDLILSGEGKLDVQTLSGKVIHGIGQLAIEHKIPFFALCGNLELKLKQIKQLGLTGVNVILDKPMSENYSMQNVSDLLNHATERLIYSLCAYSKFNRTYLC